jgi:hypothetical protein
MSIIEKSRKIEEIVLRNTGRRGVQDLYQALVELTGGSPTLRSATSLHKAIMGHGNVIIASGFTTASVGKCETDGLIGSIVLAEFLNKIGCHVIFTTDPQNQTVFEKVGRAAHLNSFECVGFPIEHDSAKKEAVRSFKDLAPTALVAIERPGWNRKMIYHNMRGEDISSKTAKIDHMFNMAQSSKILTIAVGDGGNEVGMGNILEAVMKSIPFGSICQCPCRGGIACITKVDHLVVSSVSNWGAYALVALTALLAKTPFRHTASLEKKLIESAIQAGAVDGVSGRPIPFVDGQSIAISSDVVERISKMLSEQTS